MLKFLKSLFKSNEEKANDLMNAIKKDAIYYGHRSGIQFITESEPILRIPEIKEFREKGNADRLVKASSDLLQLGLDAVPILESIVNEPECEYFLDNFSEIFEKCDKATLIRLANKLFKNNNLRAKDILEILPSKYEITIVERRSIEIEI
ncbi:MAG: hypothetical protein WC783_00385 [Candidatus Paceibacterota bacterium]|jgi:hypothetical protein